MGVNKIMSLKIMDVKIWLSCISYASWLCEEKEKLKKWLWNGNENEKTPKMAKMKRKEK